ncbi:hypothetical protein, partial [Mycoplasmoides pneumoniae]
GLKVKDATVDSSKQSTESLKGEESSSSSTTSSTSTTQRGGSSGDTKVKALQVAVKKKSDSEDNGQIELETNNLANAP